MTMKKKHYLLLCLFLLFSAMAFSQNATVHFDYDINGNRISRYLSIRKMEENGKQTDTVNLPSYLSEAKDSLGNAELSIYPNPTHDKLIITLQGIGDDKVFARLISPTGSLIKQYELHDDSSEIDLSGLPIGAYLLQLSATDVSQTWKIIKN